MGIWDGDRLGRSRDAEWLADFLRRRSKELSDRGEKRAYVLNIDARWGDGKTFFMKRFRDELAQQHIAVYVDAWRNDFADDPLTAVMAAIDEVVAQRTKKPIVKKTLGELKGKAGQLAKLTTQGVGLRLLSMAVTTGVATAIAEVVTSSDGAGDTSADEHAEQVGAEVQKAFEKVLAKGQQGAVDAFVETRNGIRQFTDKLAKFVLQVEQNEDFTGPLFILIDELDRCRPPYAIAMLESVKHIFETPNVVFVFATNSKELCHSINAIYGAGFDSKHYLNRFFDRTYTFEPTPPAQFVDALLAAHPIDAAKVAAPFGDGSDLIREFFVASDLDLRSIGQIYDTLRYVAEAWNERVPIELVVLLPLIASYHENRANFEHADAAKQLGRTSSQWQTRHHHNGQWVDVRYGEFAKSVLDAAQGYSLPAAINRAGNGPVGAFISRRMGVELAMLHSNRYSMHDEPRSVIAAYRTLVRRAGRMTFPDETSA